MVFNNTNCRDGHGLLQGTEHSTEMETHYPSHCLAMASCLGCWSLVIDVFSPFTVLALSQLVTTLTETSISAVGDPYSSCVWGILALHTHTVLVSGES
jgi:hypothetical protein